MKTRFALRAPIVAIALLAGLTAACVEPAPPATQTWAFKGTSVTVLDSQDETLGLNRRDEPYLLQVAFRVKIGQPGSAQAFVTGNRDNAINDVGVGETVQLTGARQATATFGGLAPLDVLDLANAANKLEVFGTYTWAVEQDSIGIQSGANGTATVLKDALNATLAQAALPSDTGVIVDLIVSNLLSAFNILLANIPTFGLGDDTLGAGLYIGIAAKGTLGSIIDNSIATTTIPAVNLLGDNRVPPKIVGGNLYSMTGARNFTTTFTGAGGSHRYTFAAGPA